MEFVDGEQVGVDPGSGTPIGEAKNSLGNEYCTFLNRAKHYTNLNLAIPPSSPSTPHHTTIFPPFIPFTFLPDVTQ